MLLHICENIFNSKACKCKDECILPSLIHAVKEFCSQSEHPLPQRCCPADNKCLWTHGAFFYTHVQSLLLLCCNFIRVKFRHACNMLFKKSDNDAEENNGRHKLSSNYIAKTNKNSSVCLL